MPSLLPHHSPPAPRKGREGKHPHSQSRALLLPAAVTRADSRGSDRSMSRGSKGGRGGALDLKLHLSPPSPSRGTERAASSSDEEWSSSPSSCLSSEGEREPLQLQWSDSPEATSMVLAACPRCLMYVMLSEADPRCPRCRSPVLLDFLHRAARNVVSGGGGGRREGDDHHGRGGGGRNRTA